MSREDRTAAPLPYWSSVDEGAADEGDGGPRGEVRGATAARIEDEVRRGLSRRDKRLPAWLFYDEEGSRLYELITALPEYYPTRTERRILEERAPEIVEACAARQGALFVLELGAGTGQKSQIVLHAVARRQPRALFVPCDVSRAPLELLQSRFAAEEPGVDVRPVEGHHDLALAALRHLPDRQLVMFLGSSIGNYEGADAVRLLSGVRTSLRPGAALLLGTDMRKSEAVLVPAYDDAAGVTAAFNRNVLARINRELGGHFRLESFRHVALYDRAASRVEMHLESTVDQRVAIDALDLEVHFGRGERIHTESSVKYDLPMVDDLLRASGFEREATFADAADWFSVHVARAAHGPTPSS